MMKRKVLLVLLLIALAASFYGIAAAEETAQSEKWEFDAAIYLWGASIGGKTGTGGDIDISFDDLLSNLEMAFMGAVGVRKGKWSLMLDAIYMDVKGTGSVTIPVDELLLDINGSLELTAWVFTPSVGYNLFKTERIYLDVLAGARYLYLKTDAKFNFSAPLPPIQKRDTVSDSIWDGIVGIRGQVNLNKNWYLPYYADIGTGSSNITWQLFGGIGYRFKWLDLILAYRYMEWNFDDSNAFEDLTLHGPFIGVKFRL